MVKVKQLHTYLTHLLIGLDNLSGVAAILRFPLPGIDDIEEEDYDQDAEEEGNDEESKTDEGKEPKMTFDEEQLQLLLS